MTYESPITVLTEKLTSKVSEELDNQIVGEVLRVGIDVNKDELLKALKYDREQYDKGYKDGFDDGYKEAHDIAVELFIKR